MNKKKGLTLEDVDNAIRRLEESHAKGEEDPELYPYKRENLYELRGIVLEGPKGWRRLRRKLRWQKIKMFFIN